MQSIRRIIREVHRRSVWQVLAVYLLGSWVGYEVVLALTEGIGLPAWVPGLAVVLFVVGLPIVLATAIVQEGHPLRGSEGPEEADWGVDGLETAAAAVAARREVDAPAGDSDIRGGGTPDAESSPAPATAEHRARPADPDVPPRGSGPPGVRASLTWKRVLTAGVLGFAGLGLAATGFMGMRSLGIGPAATLVSSGALGERELVVLADFEAEDRDVADVVTEALRIDLLESTALTLAEPGHVSNVLRRMERDPADGVSAEVARELAIREGIKAVISGEVRELGGRYVLTASVEAAAEGAILAGFREEAESEAGLLEAVDALGTRIREKVGESLRSVRRSDPLARVTSSSLDALRLYSRAMQVQARTGNAIRVAELLERAVETDSTFAVAWRALGVQYMNAGRFGPRMQEAFRTAYRFRDRLQDHERYMAEAAYHEYVENDSDAAAAAYQALLEIHPDHTPALNNLGGWHTTRGRHEEAVRLFRRATALSDDALHRSNLALALLRTGEIQEAERVTEEGLAEIPGNARLLFAAAVLALERDDMDRADSLAAALASSGSLGSGMFLGPAIRGATRGLRGRASEATALFFESANRAFAAEAYIPAGNHVSTILDYHLLVRPDTAAARALLDQVVAGTDLDALSTFASPHAFVARLRARTGQPERARHHLQRDSITRQSAGLPPSPGTVAEGLLAMAEGRLDEAARLLEAAADGPDAVGCPECVLGPLGEVYTALDQPDAAIDTWSQLLESRHPLGRILGSAWRPYVARRLGELHDARGDTENAVRFYVRFLEWWTDPDPDLEPVVERVRERVAALTSQPG